MSTPLSLDARLRAALEKATPGPWTQDCLLVRSADRETVAHCTRWEHGRPKPETAEANAALIVLLREAADARRLVPQAWQDISTAPKDGACLVVVDYRDRPGGLLVVGEAQRYADGWFWAQQSSYDSDPLQPTHWMKLPEPPYA